MADVGWGPQLSGPDPRCIVNTPVTPRPRSRNRRSGRMVLTQVALSSDPGAARRGAGPTPGGNLKDSMIWLRIFNSPELLLLAPELGHGNGADLGPTAPAVRAHIDGNCRRAGRRCAGGSDRPARRVPDDARTGRGLGGQRRRGRVSRSRAAHRVHRQPSGDLCASAAGSSRPDGADYEMVCVPGGGYCGRHPAARDRHRDDAAAGSSPFGLPGRRRGSRRA